MRFDNHGKKISFVSKVQKHKKFYGDSDSVDRKLEHSTRDGIYKTRLLELRVQFLQEYLCSRKIQLHACVTFSVSTWGVCLR